MSNENKKNNDLLKWLKVGGILCAIAGGSAVILTSLNLLTAPIIQKNNASKTAGGYLSIFSNYDHSGDKVALESDTLASYEIAYDSSNAELGYVYTTKSIAVKAYGNITAMIGVSGSTDSPTLGKVYLVEDSLSYKTTFESNYVEKYNANPSDTTLNDVKCGATFAASALQELVNAARDHYISIGDPFKEDLASDITAIWGDEAGYVTDYCVTSNFSDASSNLKKYHSFYEDDTMTGEMGRLYSGKFKDAAGDVYITVGFESEEYGKLVITKNTVEDEAEKNTISTFVDAYNANPSIDVLNTASGKYATAIKDMVVAAHSDLATNTLKSSTNAIPTIVNTSAYKSISKPTVLEASSDNERVLRYWSLFSDEEGTKEVAKVYKINVDMAEEENPGKGIYANIESHTTFLITISGETEPILGKIATLKSEGGAGQLKTINDYLDNFDGSQNEDSANKTGATYTLKAVWRGINKAKELYSKDLAK